MYIGYHMVTVRVAYSATQFVDLMFILTIDPCVVTGLTLNGIINQVYTIGDLA